MRPAAILACLLPISLAMLAALQATPLTAQAPAKAIGPKPDDPRAKDCRAIGPKPDDPKAKDPKAIGPKLDDPRAKEAKGAAKQVPAKR
ncbi:hypothetical protein [Geothrix campi]|uniref:hypothetical protein n=1 Tax=Geothrix campi TaxID=2966450 RepID=UPI002148165D|nr:hypothetical protein [Geothrix sp. SG10]